MLCDDPESAYEWCWFMPGAWGVECVRAGSRGQHHSTRVVVRSPYNLWKNRVIGRVERRMRRKPWSRLRLVVKQGQEDPFSYLYCCCVAVVTGQVVSGMMRVVDRGSGGRGGSESMMLAAKTTNRPEIENYRRR